MNAFPPPPPPKLGLLAWLRIAVVLFLTAAVAVLALFFTGVILVLALVAAAVFSAWATFKLRRSTIKGHYETFEVRTHRGHRVIRGDYLEVEDSQDLDGSDKGGKRGRKTKPGAVKKDGKGK